MMFPEKIDAMLYKKTKVLIKGSRPRQAPLPFHLLEAI
jgi:hypothetical protein